MDIELSRTANQAARIIVQYVESIPPNRGMSISDVSRIMGIVQLAIDGKDDVINEILLNNK
jgi:hypothetical protein